MDIELNMDRFQVVDKNLNSRQAALKQYCDRMPSLSPALIASKMAHLSTEELNTNYHYMSKNAKNFIAYWKWCFLSKN